MIELQYKKVIYKLGDYVNSPEFKEIWDGYDSSIRLRTIAKSKFLAAYVVPVDKETNYGISFRLFRHYEIDGIRHLKEERITSSLTNAPLEIVRIDEVEMKIIFTGTYIPKTEETFRRLKITKAVVL